MLETLSIENEFDFVHSAENETHGKPHPAVFLTVAKKLGAEAHKCLVIEDSLNGIVSGKAARMTVVCIPEKNTQSGATTNACGSYLRKHGGVL